MTDTIFHHIVKKFAALVKKKTSSLNVFWMLFTSDWGEHLSILPHLRSLALLV